MNHRLRHNRPDWVDVPSVDRTFWQRVAAATGGYATPGNALTVAGLFLSLLGLSKVYDNALLTGLLLLGAGRVFDVLDGFVAAATGTKGRVGEALDAGADKVVAGTALLVFAAKATIPALPLTLVLAQTVANTAFSIIAKCRGRELHSSTLGKRAAVWQWLALLCFVLARIVSADSVFIADLLNGIGYMLLLLFLIPAIDSTIGYARHALRRKAGGKYTDNEGSLHQAAGRAMRAYWRRKWLVAVSAFLAFVLLLSVYGLAASPYSSDSFVQSPFTTTYTDGRVALTQHFTPHIYRGWFASTVAYVEQFVTDVWARMRSPKEPAGSVQSIAAAIYAQRFDPSKPYIISGDQFSALYLRNLSIFYQDLLNPHTALNPTDWHNRERIAVQSLAYALSATQQLKYPVTTLMPISPRGVIAVNFWNYPSDSMFSLFQLLQNLEANPETQQVALQLQHQYGTGLQAAYQNYVHTVRDPQTGLVRGDMHISSARDAVQRSSSFYDNVILWRSEQQAAQLGFDHVTNGELATMRQQILARYWDNSQGHFIDDTAPGNQHSYSSDWLIALQTGFLDPTDAADRSRLEQLSAYIDKEHLAEPLPIRYTNDADTSHQDFFVRYFVGSYGNTAIWSYWGNLYMTLETDLYQQTHRAIYARHVRSAIDAWSKVIQRDRGYPETLDGKGNMLEAVFYESIRRNGWIVDFEAVKYDWQQTMKGRAL